jgi:putative transposase
MPRQARLDAPGTLYHVIVRGIEGRKMVEDDHDRQDFVSLMGTIASETGTAVWNRPKCSLSNSAKSSVLASRR